VSTVAARDALEAAYRTDARRVLATLIRLLGGFDAAEEALHEAFAAAALQWPREGVPANPYAWLVSTGRFRSIDRHRRQARLDGALHELAAIEAVIEQGGLDGYALAHAARADMQRRLGRAAAARLSYARALELTRQPAERRFLEARRRALTPLE